MINGKKLEQRKRLVVSKQERQKKLIEALYDFASGYTSSENIIETEELEKVYDSFSDKYIEGRKLSFDEKTEMWEHFNDVVFDYCRQGFDVGFKMAVSLLSSDEKIKQATERLKGGQDMTNYEKIKAMTAEELAKYLEGVTDCGSCPVSDRLNCLHSLGYCAKAIEQWLKRESKE